MTWGLTSVGFGTETQQEVRDRIVSMFRGAYGDQVNTDTSTVFGQYIDILSELIANAEQQGLTTYRSFDAATALGVALDARAALTGSQRKGATSSTSEGRITGVPATVVPNGAQVRLDATNTLWQITNGPLAIPPAGFLDGIEIASADTGPVTALATTAWTIVTVIVGWTAFETTEDATAGQTQESDKDFRLRRLDELFARAQGPLLAITAALSKIEGVVRARTWHNPLYSPTDSNGIPFKAFNPVVETDPPTPPAALRQEIADAIWVVLGAGGQSYGTDYSEIVIDTEGTAQPVAFDTVTQVNVWVEVDITVSDEDEAITPNIEETLEAYILEQADATFTAVGANAKEYEVTGLVYESGVTGVTSVVVRLSTVGFGGPFLSPEIPISIRERADFDSLRVNVQII